MQMSLILALSLVPAAPAAAQEQTPCEGYRYLYADKAASTERYVKLHGCRDLSPDGRKASRCEKLGEIDLARVRETQKKAVEELFAYMKGLAVGMGCYLGIEVVKLVQKPGALALRTIDGQIGRDTADKVRDATRAGRRQPGEAADPADVNKTVTSMICTQAAAAGGHSFRQGISQAMQNGSMPHVYHADAKYIWSLPPGEARRKAYAEWTARLEAKSERQRAVIEKTTGRIGALWKYMMSEELSDLPFGTSTDANVNPGSCIPGSEFTRFLKMMGNFRKVVNQSGQGLQDFQPHQGILVPAESDDLRRQVLGQKVPDAIQGVNQLVPGAQPAPTLPPLP